MARLEKTLGLANNVGTTPVTLYTVPADTKTIITGINACNVSSSKAELTIKITRSGTDYHITKDTSIDSSELFDFTGHITLDTAGDSISISSDAATSFDIIVSGWENA